jgi:hypothetical protein
MNCQRPKEAKATQAMRWFERGEQVVWTATVARQRMPTDQHIFAEDAAFAMLDRAIAELRSHVSQKQLNDMQKRRERLIIARNALSSSFRIS